MNFYKRHLGDYIKDTAHLSLLEHGTYCRLLDVYYAREAAIPDAQAARLIGARSKDEREAIRAVLEEFFYLTDGEWHNSRADKEIADAQQKAERNRVIGKLGGRPRNESKVVDSENPEITHTVSGSNPEISPASNHKPVTISQKDQNTLGDHQADAPSKAKRKTRLPAGFDLTAEHIKSAAEHWQKNNRLDLVAAGEFEKFIAYHQSHGSTMADWDAAWKTWYCNAIKFNKPPITLIPGGKHAIGQSSSQPFSTRIRNQVARALEELEQGNCEDGDADLRSIE